MTATEHLPPLREERVSAFLAQATDLSPAVPSAGFADIRDDLARLGLGPGDAVIVCLPNGLSMVGVYFAALLQGLVPLAVAPSTPAARVRALAERLRARAVVATRVDPPRYGGQRSYRVGTCHATVLDDRGDTPYRAGDVLLLTSGTRGMFTACLHRVESLLRNAHRHSAAVRLSGRDVVLVTLPLYYSYALVAQVFAAYVRAAPVVIAGPPFSPAAYHRAVERHAVTHSSLTPSVVRQMPARPVPRPLATGVLTVGGDRLAPEEVAVLLAARPDGELYLTYGLTEAGPRVSTLAAHEEPAARHASVGLPLPGVRAFLRGGTGADGAGELLVESDTVLVGRIGEDPSADGQVLLGPNVIATGDVFHIDDDGYLYFRDRLSDFLMVRGEKVSLNSVRQAAHTVPGVVHCAPRPAVADDGSTVFDVDVAVRHPGTDAEQAVRRALTTLLMPWERPRRIHVHAAGPDAFRK
ncbi:coronafacic acid synthetase [Streptomyces longispororuber]|uniref:Coronafacic acid synthetase n=1 Tax=Streptomyces longispororuber TaxID=68230 RepID=A0A918ZGK3_9ACTN|nr:class I adenylate-forming enzyme family protein [Streptomyces longispororuber]GHE48602.1 coronafacic acid synthetase [Streptomyces longispororuber]